MKTFVYMVRHAESPYIAGAERTRGLSRKGQADVKRVTEILSDEGIEVVISSPYDSEKKALRKYQIRIRDVHSIKTIPLCSILSCFEQRAKRLKALAEFQTIPSIGHKFAQNLVRLGFFSIDEFEGKDPVELFRNLEDFHGTSIDPCVEDQFRLVVHYANHPNSEKQWWDFTEERKRERSGRKS